MYIDLVISYLIHPFVETEDNYHKENSFNVATITKGVDFGGIAYKHQFDRLLHLTSKLQIVMDGENKVRQVRKATIRVIIK